jgi:hypothetical protein
MVVCEFGDVDLSGAAAVPSMTITGTVHPGTAPGALVQNLVSVTSAGRAGDPARDVVSNAYLVGAVDASRAPATTSGANPPRGHASALPAVGALLAVGCLAMAGLVLLRRRRGS